MEMYVARYIHYSIISVNHLPISTLSVTLSSLSQETSLGHKNFHLRVIIIIVIVNIIYSHHYSPRYHPYHCHRHMLQNLDHLHVCALSKSHFSALTFTSAHILKSDSILFGRLQSERFLDSCILSGTGSLIYFFMILTFILPVQVLNFLSDDVNLDLCFSSPSKRPV